MELFSAEFFTALLTIIVIDLVLAGDNAIVIGMAARNLPLENQKKVIMWGTVGAVVIRVAATLVVVELLKIPYLRLVGGLLLVWIAYKLLVEEEQPDVAPATSMIGAIKTIIIADAAMGLDNVLGVAGAAQGQFILVVLGLLISVPIVVWGSTYLSRLMGKYPIIIYIGAAVLAYTAGHMITQEPKLGHFFQAVPAFKYLLVVGIVGAVLFLGYRSKHKPALSGSR